MKCLANILSILACVLMGAGIAGFFLQLGVPRPPWESIIAPALASAGGLVCALAVGWFAGRCDPRP